MLIDVMHFVSSPNTRLRSLKGLGLSLALMLAILIPGAAMAQNSNGQGNITGRVTDQHGLVVAGAQVTVTDNQTKVSNTTKSNNSGIYNVQSLIPGTYTVKIVRPGFKESLTDNIIVSAGLEVPVNAILQIGSEAQVVTVEASGELLSNTSDVSTTVDRAIVENLPYPEQSALEAVLLVPGVVGDSLNPGGIQPENPNAFTNYFSPGASISIGGAPPGTSAIILDGSDMLEASYPRVGLNLSGQMIQETTVYVTGLSAQFGRTGGGAIVEVSRSGTSQYHGSAYWRHTDPFFWATTPGQLGKTDQHEQFFGFFLGGPVRIPHVFHGDDKTFFFVGVEPAQIHELNGAVRGNFLTPAELNGQLHNSLDILNQSVVKASGYAAALLAPRTTGVGYDTPIGAGPGGVFPSNLTYASTGSYVQATGPLSDCTNNGITQSDFAIAPTVCHDDLAANLVNNPFAQFVVSLMPTPSNPGPYVTFDQPNGAASGDLNNGYYRRGVDNTNHRYSFRIDHQFNNNNSINVRYTNIPLNAGRIFALAPTNPMDQTPTDVEHGYDVSVGYTRVLTSNLVNNAHYSWFRENLQRLPPLPATTTDFGAKYGLVPAVLGYGFPGLGNFNSNGASYTIQPGGSGYSQQVDQNFIMGDDVSLTRGPHQMTFGFDYRWIQSNQYDFSKSAGGTYSFASGSSAAPNGQAACTPAASCPGGVVQPALSGGSAWGTFLEGISGYNNAPVEVPGYYRYKYWGVYFQDNWRASAKLTLNLGLRYEVQVPREEAKNNQAYVSTSVPGTLNGVPTSTGFCFSGACGLGRSLWPTNYFGIEPRIGFAYAISPKSTLRGAYTITRPPLSGTENIPDIDFNVQGSSAATNTAVATDYVNNPIAPASLVSSYTQLNGARGPFYFSTGVAPVFVDQTTAVPNVQMANLTYQYQPFSKTLIQVTYQHTRGEHLYNILTIAQNVPSYSTLLNYLSTSNSATAPYLPNNELITGAAYPAAANPATNYNTYGILATNNTAGSPINETGIQHLYPYQNFFNQTLNDTYARNGDSHYDAMYLSVNQRATKTLTLLASYVWSKSLDDVPDTNNGSGAGSGTSTEQNPQNLRGEYSVSTFDQDSVFKAGYNMNLPFGIGQKFNTGKSWVDSLIGGFSTSGFFTEEVGYPNYVSLGNSGYFYDVVPNGAVGTVGNYTSKCTTANYCIGSVLPANFTLRPNINPGVPLINPRSYWKSNPYNVPVVSTVATSYLNSAAFSVPGSIGNPQFGNAPRTLSDARSPRQFFFDAAVNKAFAIHERYRVVLNMNLNNAFNHPVYFASTSRSPFSGLATTATSTTFAGTLSNNQPQVPVTNPSGTPVVANFGTLGNAGAQVMSRVIRIGATVSF